MMNALINKFHQTERHFFSSISFTEKKQDHLIAYASGVDAAGLNPALVQNMQRMTFKHDLIICQDFYREHQLPWALVVPEYFQKNTAYLIEEQGIYVVDEGIAMLCLLEEWKPVSSSTDLVIKEMNHDLNQWSFPIIYGFESTPERMDVYTQRHLIALEKKRNFYHFSGFIGDEAVCSLTVSLLGAKYARLDDVATIPAHQGRGYATTLIHSCLDFLKNLQIEACFLEASTSGFSIYRKIGFKELFKNYYYELQA